MLQKQTLKLSGHSNTVVAAVETPLSTMRIVFKIASFAHFSTSPLLLHIKIRYGHQRRTYYTSSFTKPKNNTLLIDIVGSWMDHFTSGTSGTTNGKLDKWYNQ